VTPAEIGAEIRAALDGAEGAPRQLLQQALDALSDGQPADDVETILRLALRSLDAASPA
jgi:hypothetical protein